MEAELDATVRIALPPILDLSGAASLKQQCQTAIAGGASLVMDASAVSKVTTPCLQVLAATSAALNQMGGATLTFTGASQSFRDSVTGLGLCGVLHIEDQSHD